MAERYLRVVIPIRLPFLLAAAVPVQLAFLAAHLVLVFYFPQKRFQREVLPLVYLTATYLQWLLFSFWISWRTKRRYPVPLLMHLPHLLSFLPLVRHVMIAASGGVGAAHDVSLGANRAEIDATSLMLAWLHAVASHSFSLVAAWLWQMRSAFDVDRAERRDLLPIIIYGISAITTILIYAGLDLSFAANSAPLAVGLIQLLLSLSVTGLLVLRESKRITALTLIPALVFSLVNGALLFDTARAEIGVEIALAGASFTQIFTLYVFLHYSRDRNS